MLYYLVKLVLTPILRILHRPWAEGLENVPAKGPAILASNHLSFSDSFFLPIMLSRRVTFLAKSEYFTGPGLKGRLTAAFFRGVGQVPVDRSGGSASEGALRTALKVLGEGELLGIYPEGTRSPDGRLYRGKTGIARMALEAGVPIIPVVMINTDKVQPTGSILPKSFARVGIRFGKPLDFSRYAGMADNRYVLRSVTDELMYEMMKLSGQDYVDMYAVERKMELSATRKAQHAAEKAEKKAQKKAGKTERDDAPAVASGTTGTAAAPVAPTALADGRTPHVADAVPSRARWRVPWKHSA